MGLKLPLTLEESHCFIAEQSKLIEELSVRLLKLERENNELKELLNRNSNNSSQPPSQSKIKPKNHRIPSGKSSGGQKGHEGHYRKLLAEEEVNEVVYCPLPKRCTCGCVIAEEGSMRHQVYELPEIKLNVTEYKLSKGTCFSCGRHHIAELPKGVTWGITGPKLTSFMSSLTSRYQLSRREVKEFLREHLSFSLSLGTIFNKEKKVADALERPVKNLLAKIAKNSFLHADETGHKRDCTFQSKSIGDSGSNRSVIPVQIDQEIR